MNLVAKVIKYTFVCTCKAKQIQPTTNKCLHFPHIALYYYDTRYQPDYWCLPDVIDSLPMTRLQALKETFQWWQTKTDSLKSLLLVLDSNRHQFQVAYA